MVNKFKGNKLIHIPVTVTPEDINDKYHGKQLSWWSDNPLYSYNAMLVSAHKGMDGIKNRKEIRDNVLFLGDSGGYQILQTILGKLDEPYIFEKLTWQKVIEWQLENCDIGMTLDIPPPRTEDKIYTPEEFNDYLLRSKENAISMYKYKDFHISEAYNPDFKLFNCIHGSDYNEMELWHKETTDNHDIEYDGFSLPGNGAKFFLPLKLGFAMEYSTGKPYHILGVSSPQRILLVAYTNKYTKTQVYFDSSTASLGKQVRRKLTHSYFYNYGIKHSIFENQEFDCHCSVCSQVEDHSDFRNKRISGTLITLHNLCLLIEYTNFVNKLVESENDFIRYVKSLPDAGWLLQCMEYLDYVHETNFETAWNLYSKILNKASKKKSESLKGLIKPE